MLKENITNTEKKMDKYRKIETLLNFTKFCITKEVAENLVSLLDSQNIDFDEFMKLISDPEMGNGTSYAIEFIKQYASKSETDKAISIQHEQDFISMISKFNVPIRHTRELIRLLNKFLIDLNTFTIYISAIPPYKMWNYIVELNEFLSVFDKMGMTPDMVHARLNCTHEHIIAKLSDSKPTKEKSIHQIDPRIKYPSSIVFKFGGNKTDNGICGAFGDAQATAFIDPTKIRITTLRYDTTFSLTITERINKICYVWDEETDQKQVKFVESFTEDKGYGVLVKEKDGSYMNFKHFEPIKKPKLLFKSWNDISNVIFKIGNAGLTGKATIFYEKTGEFIFLNETFKQDTDGELEYSLDNGKTFQKMGFPEHKFNDYFYSYNEYEEFINNQK